MRANHPSPAARSSTQTSTWVAVDPAGSVLGRDPTCDLILPSEQVSRRHAIVSARGGGYVIEDLGSRNGTTVNGRAVVGAAVLQDGDRLRLAEVEVEFRSTDIEAFLRAGPSTVPWWPTASTAELPEHSREDPPDSPPALRRQLHDSAGFGVRGLLMAIAGSLVGTVLTGFAGTGQWGILAAAALSPIVSTAFSTTRAGDVGRVRAVAVVLLSAAALFITWAGVSLADVVSGRSVVPGTHERAMTFPAPGGDRNGGEADGDPAATEPSAGVALEFGSNVNCGTVTVGDRQACNGAVTITSTGDRALHITRLELVGAHGSDFDAQDCVGQRLDHGETCAVTVWFAPTAAGSREAELVIHQNVPPPDTGTRVALAGTGRQGDGWCKDGFVPRLAIPGDDACVTQETRDQVLLDNSLQHDRRGPDEDTCIHGYVWRGAMPSDHTCVTPAVRELTQRDNLLAESRRIGG
jgi:FHA domain